MEKPNLFYTGNAQLAFALLNAGATLLSPPDGPAQNVYSIGVLRQLVSSNPRAASLRGRELEDAAQLAFDFRLPGIVTYFFERNDLLELAIAAWDAMAHEFQVADAESRSPIVPLVDTVQVMQTAYVLARNRKAFADLPFINRPMVTDMHVTEKTEGDTQTFTGSGSTWTVGASERLRAGLKRK